MSVRKVEVKVEVNKIYLGDCQEIIKTLPDNSIDLIVTDPDYEMSVNHGSGAFGVKKKITFTQIENICKGFDLSILDEFCRVLKKINIYIFCSKKQIPDLLNYFVVGKKCYFDLLPWHKTNPVPTCNNKYLPDTEHCLFFREKGVPLFGDFKSKQTYYLSQSNKKDKVLYGHPTPKPLELIEKYVRNSSLKGDMVLDPFFGSGTTGVAALKNERFFIGIEKDINFYQIAEKRIREHSKQLNIFE